MVPGWGGDAGASKGSEEPIAEQANDASVEAKNRGDHCLLPGQGGEVGVESGGIAHMLCIAFVLSRVNGREYCSTHRRLDPMS